MVAEKTEQAKLERLIFFSDAVFAIAMTLLVVDVRLPPLRSVTDAALGQALVDLLPNYIGFVVSFLVIGRFWVGHHRLMGMLHSAGPAVVRANLFLLMAVAFMPFPTAVLSDFALLRVAIGFYTGLLVVVGLANMWLVRTALSHRRPEDRADAADDERALRRSMWSPLVIAAIGFAAGMIEPVAGLVALTFVSPVILLLVSRRTRRGGTVGELG